ncbi:MAG: tetratricopeptide repeat protein [Alphaproteobacteria bacterium]
MPDRREAGDHPARIQGHAERAAAAPASPAAWDLGAALDVEQGRFEAAAEKYRKIIALAPEHAAAHFNLGIVLNRLGQRDEALAAFEKAAALGPDFVEALNALAHARLAQRRAAEAEALYRRVCALRPTDAEAHNNLGVALAHQGKTAEAETCFRRSLDQRPDFPDALSNLGLVLKKSGRGEAAIPLYRRALAANPDFADAMNNLGVALTEKGEKGETAEAIALLRRAGELRPNDAEPFNNLGNALVEAGRFPEAIEALKRAVALRPHYPEAYSNLGIALREAGALEDSIASLNKSLEQRPGYAEALLNLGHSWRAAGDADKAIACNEAAIAARPDLAEAHWNLALARLLKGDFAAGFRGYEWRFKRPKGDRPRPCDRPRWTRGAPPGSTVLVYAEQGLGDTIQLARYVPRLKALGFNVVLEVQPALKRMFGGIDGIETVGRGEALPPFDSHIPLLSLPAALDASLDRIPAARGYLRADPARTAAWRERLGAGTGGLRVGLVWRGNPKHGNDRLRSLDPALLEPLFHVPDVRLFSLQKEPRDGDLETLRRFGPLDDLAPDLSDFSETGAALGALDLAISVDTSVAHLAGALGRPVWILVPFAPDWRWLLEREDSPWYRSARLFRQARPRDWAEVMARVARALEALAT